MVRARKWDRRSKTTEAEFLVEWCGGRLCLAVGLLGETAKFIDRGGAELGMPLEGDVHVIIRAYFSDARWILKEYLDG